MSICSTERTKLHPYEIVIVLYLSCMEIYRGNNISARYCREQKRAGTDDLSRLKTKYPQDAPPHIMYGFRRLLTLKSNCQANR